MRKIQRVAYALLLGLAAALPATGQEAWPTRAVRIVVPASPGAGTDTFARLLAEALAASLRQPFIVENKPGAGLNIGAETVAKSAPDGYTLLLSPTGVLVVNPSIYRNLPFRAERDFIPVARAVTGLFVFVAHPSVPANTLADLAAIGKSQPGKLSFGAVGMGTMTYLAVRMLEEATGARFLYVPYKGMGQAYPDLFGGQINFVFVDLGSALPHIKGGKVRALAATRKTPLLPSTLSLAEAGFPNIEATAASFSMFAPAGTPARIVQRLADEIRRAMQAPALAAKLDALALVPVFDTPEEFAAGLKKESEAWATFIRRHGIALD